MNVLAITSMYPSQDAPVYEARVHEQIDSLRALGLSVDVLKIGGAVPRNGRNAAKYSDALSESRYEAHARSRPER